MTFAEDVAGDSPVVWWDTRQADGTSQPDRSGNERVGTITGAPALDADGLTFNGSGQRIASADIAPAAYAGFAFEAVVRPTVLTAYYGSLLTMFTPTLVGALNLNCQDDGEGVLTYQGQAQDADDVRLVFDDPTLAPAVGSGLQHLLLDFDGTNLTLYLDGAVYGTNTGAAFDVDLLEGAPFYLGDDVYGGDGYRGLIRHGIFYDHSLGPTVVAAHATAALNDDPAAGNLYTPPIAYDMGPINPDTEGLPRALFRHYSPHGRYLTVWKLADSTYTLEQPWPLVSQDDQRQGNLPIGNATQVTYLHCYQAPETVSDAEAARLIASGIGTVS